MDEGEQQKGWLIGKKNLFIFGQSYGYGDNAWNYKYEKTSCRYVPTGEVFIFFYCDDTVNYYTMIYCIFLIPENAEFARTSISYFSLREILVADPRLLLVRNRDVCTSLVHYLSLDILCVRSAMTLLRPIRICINTVGEYIASRRESFYFGIPREYLNRYPSIISGFFIHRPR